MAQVLITNAVRTGDSLSISGTVDGVTLSVQVWMSYLNTLGTQAAKRTYVAQQLKAAADAATPATVDLSGAAITIP